MPRKCVEPKCDSTVAGKDSWRCPKHEYAYYAPTFHRQNFEIGADEADGREPENC